MSTSTTSTGGTTSTSTGAGGSGLSGGDSGVGGEPCADYVEPAVPTQRPIDIICLIDNSGTMSLSGKLSSVEQNINGNFAQAIVQANIDYRLIMVTDHGAEYDEVCIGPPLGTGTCQSAPLEVPNQYYHYDVTVGSHDSLCIALDTIHGSNGGGQPDQHGVYPNGWITALRPEAFKAFVEITDDGIYCTHQGTMLSDMDQIAAGQTVAVTFDPMLLQASPAQFGTTQHRSSRNSGVARRSLALAVHRPAPLGALRLEVGDVALGGPQQAAKRFVRNCGHPEVPYRHRRPERLGEGVDELQSRGFGPCSVRRRRTSGLRPP